MIALDQHPTLIVTLAALAVWRLTHLLRAEDGPWQLIVRIRKFAGNGVLGSLLDCFYCLSLWIALPFAGWLGASLADRFLLWLALSGAAILLERATRKPETVPLTYFEDPEKPDELLR